MNNQVVRQFLESFFLSNRVDSKTFSRERSSLFSPCVLTFILNFRGAFEYHGIDDSIAGLYEWFEHFHVREPYCLEYLVETSTRVYVKLDGDIDFTDPIDGVVSSGLDNTIGLGSSKLKESALFVWSLGSKESISPVAEMSSIQCHPSRFGARRSAGRRRPALRFLLY